MKIFINLITSIFFVTIFFSNLIAQEKTESNKPKNTFNFYFINGYAISYDFYKAQSFYLRAQLDLSTDKEDIDSDGEHINYNNGITEAYSATNTSDNSYFMIGASVHIVFPVYTTDYGKIYLGTGPVFTYSNSSYSTSETRKNSETQNDDYKTITSSILKNYDVAAIFFVGVEAIITENFSVFAETSIKSGKRWQSNEWEHSYTYFPFFEDHKENTNTDGNGWFYEAQFIRLGVSISL